MADASGVYRFESFSDVDLFDLSEIARTEDYPRLAQWILGHKDRELMARSNRHLERRRTEYDELKERLMRAFHRFAAHNPLGLKRVVVRDVSDINTVADRMLELLDENEIDKTETRNLINRDSLRKVVRLLADTAPRNAHPEMILDYERRLEDDHVFLLEELIHILTVEYDKRVMETRRRFEEYLTPHQRIVSRMREDIREIDENLKHLTADPRLLPEEREKIRSSFVTKKSELRDIEKVEAFKLKKIEFLCLSIKDGVTQFRRLIDSLQSKLNSYKGRQSYVDKLARLGARIPEFRHLLESLYESFQHDIGDLQKSFLVFDRSFQELVLRTVDSEQVVNRIILAPSQVVDAEMEIVNTSVAEGHAEEEIADRDIDLSFLKSYRN